MVKKKKKPFGVIGYLVASLAGLVVGILSTIFSSKALPKLIAFCKEKLKKFSKSRSRGS